MIEAMRRWGKPLAESVALVAAVTGIAHLLEGHLGIANLALLYLLPVMVQAGRRGLGAGLATSTLAALAFNFFLVPPRYTLHVADPDNLVTMLVLFGVALAVSELTARLRLQAERAERMAQVHAHLAAFSEQLSDAKAQSEVLDALDGALTDLMDVRVRHVDADSAAPPEAIASLDWAAARWAVDNGVWTGRGTAIMSGAEWMFAPLSTDAGSRGVLAVAREDAGAPVRGDDQLLFDGLLDRAQQALARIALAREAHVQESNREREQLREVLLSSIGHDLRTPLTAIRGGLASLVVAEEHKPALADVQASVSRLERLVTNMLEMTRIEAGALTPHRDVIDLIDTITAALESLPPVVAHSIHVSLPHDLPMVRADPHMLHHMLLNLLENAVRHGNGPEGVEVSAMLKDQGLIVQVADRGPGVDAAVADIIFERFQRAGTSHHSDGSGLGLAIVRGFGNAMGLETTAANRADGHGAVFAIRFPPGLLVPTP